MEEYTISKSLSSHSHYRPDIDGLRAIAVLLVVIFHAFPEWLKGGFVGVDIFFVISGYLISRIILTDIHRGQFSFLKFYIKRIKRIFPALIVVLSTCFVMGWFVLLPDEFKELGKHIAGGAGFIANLLLWQESGYFDSQAELKPLLHLWSLGIEEQFYFLWPVLLVLACKKHINVLGVLLVLIVVSFVFNIFSVQSDPVGDFYSPFTRFWELMTGALLAYIIVNTERTYPINPTVRYQNLYSLVGGVLIAVAVVCLDKGKAFPGWWALLPVVGAALIIFASPSAWLNKNILSHPRLVFIGLISFPLYLWHWPLLSFARILSLGRPALEIRGGLVIASILLAWLTYRFIEKPIRFGQNKRYKTGGLCTLLSILLVTGYSTHIANGFAFRMPDKVEYNDFFGDLHYMHNHHLITVERHECNFYDILKSVPRADIARHCYTPHSKKVIFLWGDSHMQHLNYGLAQHLSPEISLLQVGASGCPPGTVNLTPDPLQTCNKANQFAWQKIQALKPDMVILAQQNNHEKAGYDNTIQQLKTAGVKHVVLIGPVPQWQPFLYKIMLRQHWTDYQDRMNTHLDTAILHTDELLREKYQHSKEVTYISLVNPLCNQQGCITYLNGNRKEGLITYDYGHFTLVASDYVAKTIIMPIIQNFI